MTKQAVEKMVFLLLASQHKVLASSLACNIVLTVGHVVLLFPAAKCYMGFKLYVILQ